MHTVISNNVNESFFETSRAIVKKHMFQNNRHSGIISGVFERLHKYPSAEDFIIKTMEA